MKYSKKENATSSFLSRWGATIASRKRIKEHTQTRRCPENKLRFTDTRLDTLRASIGATTYVPLAYRCCVIF